MMGITFRDNYHGDTTTEKNYICNKVICIRR